MDNIERHLKSIDTNQNRIIRLLHVILAILSILFAVYILELVNQKIRRNYMFKSYNQELHQGMDKTISSAAK